MPRTLGFVRAWKATDWLLEFDQYYARLLLSGPCGTT